MSLLTDKPEFEAEFREDLKTVLETGWATISSKDVTGLALGEMMKRSLENNDAIYKATWEKRRSPLPRKGSLPQSCGF